jgi:hypothetical protein
MTERAIKEEADDSSKDLYFYVILGVIILAFGGFILFQKLYTPPAPPTITELHQSNIEGKIDEEEGYTYNGYSFILFDGLWYTEIVLGDQAYKIPLHFGPRHTKDIAIKGELSEAFNDGPDIYVTINPIDTEQDYIALAATELASNMATAIRRKPVGACDRNETDMCSFRPIVTCETADHAMIYLLEEPGPEIEFKGICMILRGEGFDLVKAVDRLLLGWYGVQ